MLAYNEEVVIEEKMVYLFDFCYLEGWLFIFIGLDCLDDCINDIIVFIVVQEKYIYFFLFQEWWGKFEVINELVGYVWQ